MSVEKCPVCDGLPSCMPRHDKPDPHVWVYGLCAECKRGVVYPLPPLPRSSLLARPVASCGTVEAKDEQ